MNESLANQETNEPTPEPKLFGLPRPLAGGLIGILSSLLLGLLFWSVGSTAFAAALLYPGLLLLLIIESFIRVPLLEALIIFGGSSIPPAIIGSLISSKKMTSRTFGVILLVAYIALWIFGSFFFSFMD
jgi:hypothetical protein